MTVLEKLAKMLAQDGWPVEELDDPVALRTMFQGENGKWVCYAHTREDRDQLVFYSYCPVTVPSTNYLAVGEFLHRANFGLILGNFEMDFEQGEIRFRTSLDCEEVEYTDALIQPLVYANVMMMDVYLPGLMAVAFGSVSPQDALKEIESEQAKQE